MSRKNLYRVFVALCTAVAVAGANAQSVKKWVDDEGVTHYSDQAPVKSADQIKDVDVKDSNTTQFSAEEATGRIKKKAESLEFQRKQREAEAADSRERRAAEEVLARDKLIEAPKKKKKKRKKRKRSQKRSTQVINQQR